LSFFRPHFLYSVACKAPGLSYADKFIFGEQAQKPVETVDFDELESLILIFLSLVSAVSQSTWNGDKPRGTTEDFDGHPAAEERFWCQKGE
jgi:hypothetical protein